MLSHIESIICAILREVILYFNKVNERKNIIYHFVFQQKNRATRVFYGKS